MDAASGDKVTFFTLVSDPRGSARARLMVDGLRAFGGPLAESTVLVFVTTVSRGLWDDASDDNLEVCQLCVPEPIAGYPFAEKVFACAEAERMTAGMTESLVWISPDNLVVSPPGLYDLGVWHDAAFRPVHLRNVGLPACAPLDGFWSGVCDAVWMSDIDQLVESFVDGQAIRAYFNSHSCSVNPILGLFKAWRESFEQLVTDAAFQAEACADELHQVFLHQAVLSAVAVKSVLPGRLRILPPAYSYPYNLHASVPDGRRPARLNDLATVVYEDRSVDPRDMTDITVDEPLRSWLAERASRVSQS